MKSRVGLGRLGIIGATFFAVLLFSLGIISVSHTTYAALTQSTVGNTATPPLMSNKGLPTLTVTPTATAQPSPTATKTPRPTPTPQPTATALTGYAAVNNNKVVLSASFAPVVTTNTVPPGYYSITGTATMYRANSAYGNLVKCSIGNASGSIVGNMLSKSTFPGIGEYVTIAVTDTLNLTSSDQIAILCKGINGPIDSVSASITAIQLNSIQSSTLGAKYIGS